MLPKALQAGFWGPSSPQPRSLSPRDHGRQWGLWVCPTGFGGSQVTWSPQVCPPGLHFFRCLSILQWSTSAKVCTVTANGAQTSGHPAGAPWGHYGGLGESKLSFFDTLSRFLRVPGPPEAPLWRSHPPPQPPQCAGNGPQGASYKANLPFPDHFWPFPGLYGLPEGRNWPQMGPTGVREQLFSKKFWSKTSIFAIFSLFLG